VTDCARFARWLDDGMPPAGAAAHEAHASGCPGCAAALADARALDRALAGALAAAPGGFTDGVMRRVERARLVRLAAWLEPDLLPWWVRAAAEPSSVLACALAALVLWQYPLLARLSTSAWQLLSGPTVSGLLRLPGLAAGPPGLAILADPYVLAGLGLAGLPFAWWAGLAVYRWSGDVPPPDPRLRAGAPARH
jgi:hypothetical protein